MESLASLLWGDGPTEEDCARLRGELRAELGLEAEPRSEIPSRDCDLDAFLTARGHNVAQAAGMWRASQAWRRETFPIKRTEGIERILASKRFREIGFNRETPPRYVVVFDALWGAFLEGEDEDELILAFLLWLEERIAVLERQEVPVYSFIHVAVGGPPPMAWGQRLAGILEPNYPERLHKAVAYPVPWLFQQLASSALWFLPKRTREKWHFVSDLAGLANACVMDSDDFPDDIKAMNDMDVVNEVEQMSSKLRWVRTAEGYERTARAAYVAAGAEVELRVELPSDLQWLECTCRVDEGYDVGVSVTFEGQPCPEPRVLWNEGKFQDVWRGERFLPAGPGCVVFRFNNMHSWINGKNVCAEVTVGQ